MGEKPQKRLVRRGEYLATLLTKGGLYSTGIPVGFFGAGVLIADIYFLFNGIAHWDGEVGMLVFLVIYGILQGGIGLAAIWYSKAACTAARKLEAVAPITRHNTGSLPEVETLVRGSDLPAIAPQAELLRAAGAAPETPPEELLRATRNSRQV